MKKVIFGLIATAFISFYSTAQTSSKDWLKMIENYKSSVTSVLSKECPKGMDIEKFRTSLILGESKLSAYSLEEISKLAAPLKTYGKEFATKHKFELTDEASLIFYSSFSPNLDVKDGYLQLESSTNPASKISQQEVINCALAALGVDFLFAAGPAMGSSWTIAGMTTTFSNIAKRFLGPVGVAIAVGSFSYCLYIENQD